MIIAKIQVNGVIAKIVYRKVIPAGIIGAQVEFDYAEDIWHGLHKTVVFKGAVTKDVVTDANIVTIPHEVVEKPFFRLKIGVYGVDADGNIAIPTLWEDIGAVLDAAAPSGDTDTDPSLPVWAQIQAMIGNLDELETTARDNLVAAVNEVAQNAAGGGVSSFNGRSGAVTPQIGDYTATMVGADAQGAAQTVQGNLNTHAENTIKHITAEERTAWDAKSDFSGSYNDLTEKPTIPTALPNPHKLTIKVGSTTVTYDGSAAKTIEIADGSEVAY